MGVAPENPAGIETIIHTDEGKLIIERKADAQPILDDVARIRHATDGKSDSGEFYHVARIPSIVIEQYCNRRGISLEEFMRDDCHVTAILNDSDFSAFRVWEGRA